jgi:cytochrome c
MPRTLTLAALLAAALGGLVSGAWAAGDVEHGRAIVEENCGRCHATGAEGDSPLPAAPHFRELSKNYPVSDLQEALAEGILTGHPTMPEFAFEPDDVADIIAYLESIQSQ